MRFYCLHKLFLINILDTDLIKHRFNFYKLMGFDNGNFMHLSPPTRNRTFPSPKTFFMLLSSQSHPASQTYLLICSLSLKIRFACFGLHTKGIVQNKRFSVSFLSHNNAWRFICAVFNFQCLVACSN